MNTEWLLLTAVSNTMQLDSSAEGTHCCTYIVVSYSYAIVFVFSHGNSGYANARHNVILYVHCLSCWTWNLGSKGLTCVLYASSLEQVCDGKDKRKAIRHESVYLVHAEFIYTWLAVRFKCGRYYRNILNVCPITRFYLSSAVASVVQ